MNDLINYVIQRCVRHAEILPVGFSHNYTHTHTFVDTHLAISAWCVLRVVVDLARPISQPSPLTALLPVVSQLKEMGECK